MVFLTSSCRLYFLCDARSILSSYDRLPLQEGAATVNMDHFISNILSGMWVSKNSFKLLWSIWFQLGNAHLMESVHGSLTISQNCYFRGLYYTSSTFGSAALNLVPVFTFLFALLLRYNFFLYKFVLQYGTDLTIGSLLVFIDWRKLILKYWKAKQRLLGR